MQPNDRPTFQAVGTLADLATAAGGNQPPCGSNVAAPTLPMPQDFAQAPMSAMSASSDFRAFAAVAGANSPVPTPTPSRLPETSTPDLSQRSYAPVDVSTTISGG